MSLVLASPLPVAAITASRGGGAARLLTADPREAFVDGFVGTPVTIRVDLGASVPVDLIFLGFTNAVAGTTWSARADVGLPTERLLFAATPLAVLGGARVHGLAMLDAVSVRTIDLTIQQPVGAAGFTAGVLTVAKAFQPTFGHEWGGGRGLLDLAPRTRHADGGFGIGDGIRKATWQATLGDLSDAELATMWALARAHGETRPLLVIEEPSRTTGLADRIHWCVFDRMEPYERRSKGRTRWGVRFEDWL